MSQHLPEVMDTLNTGMMLYSSMVCSLSERNPAPSSPNRSFSLLGYGGTKIYYCTSRRGGGGGYEVRNC